MIISFQQWREGSRLDELGGVGEAGAAPINPNQMNVARNRTQGMRELRDLPAKITAFGVNIAQALIAVENAKKGDARKFVNRLIQTLDASSDMDLHSLRAMLVQGVRAFPHPPEQQPVQVQ